MGESFKQGRQEFPKLLDLIPNERDWKMNRNFRGEKGEVRLRDFEEKKLELKLGLPGIQQEQGESKQDNSALTLSLSYKSFKRVFLDTIEPNSNEIQLSLGEAVMEKTSGRIEQPQSLDRKAHDSGSSGKKAASQTRTAKAHVVGWPPVRQFRKKLACDSSKPLPASQKDVLDSGMKQESSSKGLFVKINMDGVPIGRKIDLMACESYEKLSPAVEALFSSLLAAQRDSTTTTSCQTDEADKRAFNGLLDGSGEYTLVYEDSEGDRMLVGDVSWNTFLAIAKRLRVLKTSALSRTAGEVGRSKGKSPIMNEGEGSVILHTHRCL